MMNHSLLIRIVALTVDENSELDWFLFDHAQQLVNKGCSPLREIYTQIPSSKQGELMVYVIVPCDAVLLSRVNVPTRNSRQLRQALPYLIEELITEEIEKVHMALPKVFDESQNLIDVAIIKHSLLIQWLDLLHHHHLSPHAMVVDSLCVPIENLQHSVLIDNDKALLRLGLYFGACTQVANLASLYENYLAQNFKGDEAAPVLECIYSNTSEDQSHDTLLPSAIEYHYKESSAEILATTALKQIKYHLNLLQGGYKQGEQQSSAWATWRNFTLTASAAVVLIVASNLMSGWYFNNQSQYYADQSVSYYKQLFPEERRVVSPKRQLENHLRLLTGSDGGAFLSTMASVSPELKRFTQFGTIKINQMSYSQEQNAIQLELSSQNIEQLDDLKQSLTAVGVNTAIGSARMQEGGVISQMTIEAQP